MQPNPNSSKHCQSRMASASFTFLLTAVGVISFYCHVSPALGEAATPINPPLTDVRSSTENKTQKAVFAGGCFWGVQAVFQHTKGVTNAVSGYAGGTPAAPSYEQVSSGGTGHAEAVEVTFDPKEISFGRLLQIYFSVAHDPTQLNGRGRTRARNTAPRFSPPAMSSNGPPRPISRNSTRRMPSPARS